MDYKEYSAEDLALDGRFQKWVLGPDEEVADFWEKWAKENPLEKKKIDEARELVHTSRLSTDDKLNEAYLSVWQNLNENIVKSNELRRATIYTYLKIAAVFIGLVVVSSYFLWNSYGSSSSEYQTAYGEVKEFVLEDGSMVILNSHSRLTTAGDWNNAVREVYLEGEAFFEVKKTVDHKPFEVNTKDKLNVRVLGTEFNVSTRNERVEVYLQSGKVKITSLAGDAMLKPGDYVVYQNGDKALTVQSDALSLTPGILDWKGNFYVFNDTPFAEIVKTLEENYGYQVILKDTSLSQKKITAKVPRKDVTVLIKVISETFNVKIEQNGNELVVTER